MLARSELPDTIVYISFVDYDTEDSWSETECDVEERSLNDTAISCRGDVKLIALIAREGFFAFFLLQ